MLEVRYPLLHDAFHPLVRPPLRASLSAAAERGRQLGERASCLIAEPLELYWQDPLEQVREELGIQGSGIRDQESEVGWEGSDF